jgi:hypothetical protein
VNDVDGAALPVEQDVALNGSPALFVGRHMRLADQRVACDDSDIALADLPRFKQTADATLRLNATRHHDQA